MFSAIGYEKRSVLGAGIVGQVALCRKFEDGSVAALKFGHGDTTFDQEYAIAEELSPHRHIVKALALYHDMPQPEIYPGNEHARSTLAVEYCNGNSWAKLREYADEHQLNIPQSLVCHALAQLTEGLIHMWDHGINHADMWPVNWLLRFKVEDLESYPDLLISGFGRSSHEWTDKALPDCSQLSWMLSESIGLSLHLKDPDRPHDEVFKCWADQLQNIHLAKARIKAAEVKGGKQELPLDESEVKKLRKIHEEAADRLKGRGKKLPNWMVDLLHSQNGVENIV